MEFYSLLWTFVVLCPVLLPVCNGICQPFVFTKAEIGFAGNGSKANPLVVGHRVGRQPYDVPPDKAVSPQGCNIVDFYEQAKCVCFPNSLASPLFFLENKVLWIPGCEHLQVEPQWINTYYAVPESCSSGAVASSDAEWYCDTPKLNTFTGNSITDYSSSGPDGTSGGSMGKNGPQPCVQCQSGSRLDTSWNKFTPEKVTFENYNTFSYGIIPCISCSKGKFQDAQRHVSTVCKNCLSGQFSPIMGQNKCFKCPPGQYQASSGQDKCLACETGKYNSKSGQTLCSPCPAGRFNNEEKQAHCKLCATGTYQDQQEAKSCASCEAGTYAVASTIRQRVAPSNFSVEYDKKEYCNSNWYYPNTGTQSGGSAITLINESYGELRRCFDVCSVHGFFYLLIYRYSASVSCYCSASIEPCADYALAAETGDTVLKLLNYRAVFNDTAIGESGSDKCAKCSTGQSTKNYDTGQVVNNACFFCPKGRFSESGTNPSCTGCEPGKFTNSVGAAGCSPCEAGEFSGSVASTNCTACPLGTYNENRNAASCASCNKGTFGNTTNSTYCYPCFEGQYQNEDRQANCKQCEVGTYENRTRQHSCTQCSPGQYNAIEGEAKSCTICAPGKAQTLPGQTICNDCGFVVDDGVRIGRYSDNSGSTKCRSCPPGRFNDNASASLECKLCALGKVNGAFGGSSSDDCRACNVGKYGNSTRLNCIDCVSGYFQSKLAQSNCSKCQAGQYSPNKGSSKCEMCTKGKYGLLEGASDATSACTDCALGRISEVDGATTCSTCTGGQYASFERNECKLCGTGFYSTVTGLSSRNTTNGACTPCNPGTFSVPSRTNCSECKSYQYLKNGVCTNCTACSIPGQYLDGCGGTGGGVCKFCNNETGHYITDQDRLGGNFSRFSVCVQTLICPAGTERYNSSSVFPGNCVNCSASSHYNHIINGKCKSCAQKCVNPFQQRVGCGGTSGGVCKDCPVGTYMDYANPTSFVCSRCGGCGLGEERIDCGSGLAGKCSKCKAGFYSDKTDSSKCLSCTGCMGGEELVGCTSTGSQSNGVCTNCTLGNYKLPITKTVTSRGINGSTEIPGNYDDFCVKCDTCADGYSNENCGGSQTGTCKKWNSPTITYVSIATLSPTEGGAEFVITGENLSGLRPGVFSKLPTPNLFKVYYGKRAELIKITVNSTYYLADVIRFEPATENKNQGNLFCKTTSGVGKNYSIRLEVNGQLSNEVYNAGLSYFPPVLERFTGIDAKGGKTSGQEAITLHGSNFGTNRNADIVLKYSNVQSNIPHEYAAKDCTVVQDHKKIECRTVPGVGTNLKLFLQVAQQLAVSPSFNYRRPILQSIYGPFRNALTEGGEQIILKGTDFGPLSYNINNNNVQIQRPDSSGQGAVISYTAQYCNITETTGDESSIKCLTPAGVGEGMRVSINVGGQLSLETKEFDYGRPYVSNFRDPNTQEVIPHLATQGNASILIAGGNFGANVKKGFGTPARSVYYTTVYGETTQTPVFNIQTYKRDSSVEVDVNTGSLLFHAPPLDQLPPGKAGTHSIYLVVGVAIQPVGGQQILFGTNGTKRIKYDAPRINSIAKQQITSDRFYVVLLGENFCSSQTCGRIDTNINTPTDFATVMEWSHTQIRFETQYASGNVFVSVGKSQSNIKFWRPGNVVMGPLYPKRVFLSTNGHIDSEKWFLITDCNVNGNDLDDLEVVFGDNQGCKTSGTACKIRVEGNQSSLSTSIFNISVIKAPPGEGSNVKLSLRFKNQTSSTSDSVSYKPPRIERVVLLGKRSAILSGLMVPSSGGTIRIFGENFGRSGVANVRLFGNKEVYNTNLDCSHGSHSELNCTIGPGSGGDFRLYVQVADQRVNYNQTFGYKLPSFANVVPNEIPTVGYHRVVIFGEDLCSGACSTNTKVYICDPRKQISFLLPFNATGCFSAGLLSGSNSSALKVPVGAGYGRNHKIVVQVGRNRPIASVAETTLSYFSPRIKRITPTDGPTMGGNGAVVTIYGSNFGSKNAPTRVFWEGTGLGPNIVQTFLLHNDSALQFILPAGQGRNITVVVKVGDVHFESEGSMVNAFSYFPPTLLRIATDAGYQQCYLRQSFQFQNSSRFFDCRSYVNGNECHQNPACEWAQNYPTSGCAEYESIFAWQTRIRQDTRTNTARNCKLKATLTLLGTNFGAIGVQVWLERQGKRRKVDVKSQTHSSVTLWAPLGSGKGHSFVVQGFGQKPEQFTGVQFLYQPPLVTSVTSGFMGSNWINARGDQSREIVTLNGQNFGKEDSLENPIQIMINGKLCSDPRWEPISADEGVPYVTCRNTHSLLTGPVSLHVSVNELQGFSPARRPAPYLWNLATSILRSVEIDVDDDTIRVLSASSNWVGYARAICKVVNDDIDPEGIQKSFYGAAEEPCAICPDGGVCEANTFSDPLAKLGYYRIKLDVRDTTSKDYERAKRECQRERLFVDKNAHPSLERREYCYEFANCVPEEACSGLNRCAVGYTYGLEKCNAWENANGKTKCTSHSDCQSRGKSPRCSTAHPENCARCVISAENKAANVSYSYDDLSNGTININTYGGYCECQSSPRCELCTIGTHFRLDNKCQACPGSPVALLVLIIIGMTAFIGFAFWLQRKHFNLAFLSIGVDYFQVVALFASADVKWPEELVILLRYMRIFTIDIDVLAPECAIPDIDYEFKWWATMILPLLVLVFLAVSFSVGEVIACCNKRKQLSEDLLNGLVASFIVVFYYCYIILIKRGMEVFDCHPRVDKPDGFTYAKFVSQKCNNGLCRCWDTNHLQSKLVGPAIIFLCIYSIGFPLVLLVFLRRNKVLIKQDQLLRAAETGNTRETNPFAYTIRKRYSQMYFHFRPGKIYWIFCILMRKASVAVIGLVLSGYPSLMLAVTTLLLFFAYVMQVKHQPYMSTSQRKSILTEHRFKCEEGDEKHLLIEIGLKRALAFKSKQNEGRKRKRRRLSAIGKGIEAIKNANFEGRNYFFNFNSVEKTLLFCAILICMSGVIFGTKLMNEPKTEEQKTVKLLVGLIVIGIVLFSMVYYTLVFFTELTGKTPAWILTHCSDRKTHMQVHFEKNLQLPGIELSTVDGKGKPRATELMRDNKKMNAEIRRLKQQVGLTRESINAADATDNPLHVASVKKKKTNLKFNMVANGWGGDN